MRDAARAVLLAVAIAYGGFAALVIVAEWLASIVFR